MKNITVKIGLLFSIIWISILLILYYFIGIDLTMPQLAMMQLFFILSSISIGLYLHKKSEGFLEGNALSDIKNAMKTGIIYTIFVSFFTYQYFNRINVGYIHSERHQKIEALNRDFNNPKSFQIIKDSNPDYEVKSKEAIYKLKTNEVNENISAKFIGIFTLLFSMMFTTVYSILVTIIYRKVLLRNL